MSAANLFPWESTASLNDTLYSYAKDKAQDLRHSYKLLEGLLNHP
eukprot:XP_001708078.1 Hypothetical protein GL50803_1852 [Giardia lamblia ATCC 50803]